MTSAWTMSPTLRAPSLKNVSLLPVKLVRKIPHFSSRSQSQRRESSCWTMRCRPCHALLLALGVPRLLLAYVLLVAGVVRLALLGALGHAGSAWVLAHCSLPPCCSASLRAWLAASCAASSGLILPASRMRNCGAFGSSVPVSWKPASPHVTV
jgi:hypothetical protein